MKEQTLNRSILHTLTCPDIKFKSNKVNTKYSYTYYDNYANTRRRATSQRAMGSNSKQSKTRAKSPKRNYQKQQPYKHRKQNNTTQPVPTSPPNTRPPLGAPRTAPTTVHPHPLLSRRYPKAMHKVEVTSRPPAPPVPPPAQQPPGYSSARIVTRMLALVTDIESGKDSADESCDDDPTAPPPTISALSSTNLSELSMDEDGAHGANIGISSRAAIKRFVDTMLDSLFQDCGTSGASRSHLLASTAKEYKRYHTQTKHQGHWWSEFGPGVVSVHEMRAITQCVKTVARIKLLKSTRSKSLIEELRHALPAYQLSAVTLHKLAAFIAHQYVLAYLNGRTGSSEQHDSRRVEPNMTVTGVPVPVAAAPQPVCVSATSVQNERANGNENKGPATVGITSRLSPSPSELHVRQNLQARMTPLLQTPATLAQPAYITCSKSRMELCGSAQTVRKSASRQVSAPPQPVDRMDIGVHRPEPAPNIPVNLQVKCVNRYQRLSGDRSAYECECKVSSAFLPSPQELAHSSGRYRSPWSTLRGGDNHDTENDGGESRTSGQGTVGTPSQCTLRTDMDGRTEKDCAAGHTRCVHMPRTRWHRLTGDSPRSTRSGLSDLELSKGREPSSQPPPNHKLVPNASTYSIPVASEYSNTNPLNTSSSYQVTSDATTPHMYVLLSSSVKKTDRNWRDNSGRGSISATQRISSTPSCNQPCRPGYASMTSSAMNRRSTHEVSPEQFTARKAFRPRPTRFRQSLLLQRACRAPNLLPSEPTSPSSPSGSSRQIKPSMPNITFLPGACGGRMERQTDASNAHSAASQCHYVSKGMVGRAPAVTVMRSAIAAYLRSESGASVSSSSLQHKAAVNDNLRPRLGLQGSRPPRAKRVPPPHKM